MFHCAHLYVCNHLVYYMRIAISLFINRRTVNLDKKLPSNILKLFTGYVQSSSSTEELPASLHRLNRHFHLNSSCIHRLAAQQLSFILITMLITSNHHSFTPFTCMHILPWAGHGTSPCPNKSITFPFLLSIGPITGLHCSPIK